jgi:hypothetical protein
MSASRGIVLKNSKIEQRKKSRESRSHGISAAVLLASATAGARDRFWMKRYGPSRRRAQNASVALKIFVRDPKKTFATISALSGHADLSVGCLLSGVDRTWRKETAISASDR